MEIMNHLYDIILTIVESLLKFIAFFLSPSSGSNKFKKFVIGQRHVLKEIEQSNLVHGEQECIWIHAASLGEYGVARPIIKRLKAERPCSIILTFFSSTGYEALKNNHPDIDHVFYLPLDTRKNVRKFLDLVKPDKAVFIISEYWLNYLCELKDRTIPTFLISAIISEKAPFFQWYGKAYRTALDAYTHITVLNSSSKDNLNKIGYTRVSISGDPLFDNTITVAKTPYSNPIIEHFVSLGSTFIAGSISDDKDLNLVCCLANHNPDIRFIMVPHEIHGDVFQEYAQRLRGKAICYSSCDETTDFQSTQVLIIDFVGALAYLYRYAQWAYVGGGFTPYLHSIIEATVYGLPVSFGPEIHRKITPTELVKLNIGTIVKTEEDIITWFEELKNCPEKMKEIHKKALAYSQQNSGATTQIINLIRSV